jgi:hypothetical protein
MEFLLILGFAWIAINVAKAIIENPGAVFRILGG